MKVYLCNFASEADLDCLRDGGIVEMAEPQGIVVKDVEDAKSVTLKSEAELIGSGAGELTWQSIPLRCPDRQRWDLMLDREYYGTMIVREVTL